MRERIKYLDVAKFIGIFCIYLGHLTVQAGSAYPFVFAFYVPLFFFLSGCTENLVFDISWHRYLIKNVKGILIPLCLFAGLSIAVQGIQIDSCAQILPNLKGLLMGCIRNHFFAGGLWFLSCLFVIKVVFYALRRFIRFKWILLLISLGLYCIAELVISPCPLADPRMPFNVDSACYYTVFYALGYVCFNPIKRLLRADTTAKRVTCTTLGVLTLVGGIPWALSHGRRLISGGHSHTVGELISGLLCPLVMILLVLLLSKLLEEADLFADLGRDTLYLCGSEYLVKLLVPICLQTVGLDLVLPNPIAACVYTIALLLICHKTLVPFEKMILKKLRIIK